jgi:hypothetical protein
VCHQDPKTGPGDSRYWCQGLLTRQGALILWWPAKCDEAGSAGSKRGSSRLVLPLQVYRQEVWRRQGAVILWWPARCEEAGSLVGWWIRHAYAASAVQLTGGQGTSNAALPAGKDEWCRWYSCSWNAGMVAGYVVGAGGAVVQRWSLLVQGACCTLPPQMARNNLPAFGAGRPAMLATLLLGRGPGSASRKDC